MTKDLDEKLEIPKIQSQMEQLLRNFGAHSSISNRLEELGFRQLNDIQYFAILYKLFQGTNLLVCAPTSSGKTLIGEMACVNAILQKKGRCLYLVPLKSLAYEKLKDFREHWKILGIEVEMSTGDMTLIDRDREEEKLKTVDLLITTYERADSILRSHPDWFGTVQIVVVDEVHTIGIGQRGARLEGLLLRLKLYYPGIQFICLSATVGNPDELADWLGCELLKHDYRPVPLEYRIVLAPGREDTIKTIVKDTLQQSGSILIFTPTRYEAEMLCKEISNFIREQDLRYLIDYRELRGRISEYRAQMRTKLDQRLFFSILNGVAFHHAGVAFETKRFIEELFRKGLLKIVTCTPTLSAGINMPAKVVIIKDVGITRPYLLLQTNTFHQMCGRAGRPGFDTQGNAIVLASCEGEKHDIELMYFLPHSTIPKYEPVDSQFMEHDHLLEQFLIWIAEARHLVKEQELRELTLKTFWYATKHRRKPDMTITHLIRVGYYSLENLLLRHSSEHTIREAQMIPDSAVTIRQMDSSRLEAIIFDRTYIKASFTREFPNCACGSFEFQHRYKAKLCRHLVKLAQIAYRQNPVYTKDLLLASCHEEQLIDKLLKYRMIKIQNGRLAITDFGYLTFILYLSPKTAYWIHRQLPRISMREKFYRDIMYVYDLERKHRAKAGFLDALQRLLEDDYTDLVYQMQIIGQDLQIYPGDMEEFVESIRWIIHCFYTIADLDQISPAREFAAEAFEKLTRKNA